MGTECDEVRGEGYTCGPYPMGQTWLPEPCDHIERIGPCTFPLGDGGTYQRWFRPLAYLDGKKAPWPQHILDYIQEECVERGGTWANICPEDAGAP